MKIINDLSEFVLITKKMITPTISKLNIKAIVLCKVNVAVIRSGNYYSHPIKICVLTTKSQK